MEIRFGLIPGIKKIQARFARRNPLCISFAFQHTHPNIRQISQSGAQDAAPLPSLASQERPGRRDAGPAANQSTDVQQHDARVVALLRGKWACREEAAGEGGEGVDAEQGYETAIA